MMENGHAGSGASAQRTDRLVMELAVAPPPRVAAGVSLETPLVVTFSGLSRNPRNEWQSSGQVFTLAHLSAIWVYLSLTTVDMEETLITRREDLFCGKRADSVHRLYCEQDEDRSMVGYAAFADLVISQPGRYRIKVNIIDMDAYEFVKRNHVAETLTPARAFRGETTEDAGKVVRCLHSPVFEVVKASEHSSRGELRFGS